MSVLALDLEEGLTSYASIPGEENVHHCGRSIRILHILKVLRQQPPTHQPEEQAKQQHISRRAVEDVRYQLPTNEERLKIVRMGLKSVKENYNINGYKAIWNLCDNHIEGESFDAEFVSSDRMEEHQEILTASLHQERLTQIPSNMRPVLEELIALKNQVGDYHSALCILTDLDYQNVWALDTDSDVQYCQLCALTALLKAGASGSPVLTTSSLERSEALVATGIYYFMQSQFEKALTAFSRMEPIESGLIGAIVSRKDVALYAALAAMAILPKQSAASGQPPSQPTPEIIDYAPQSRDVLFSLRNCEYSAVMEFFELAQFRLSLDPFIAPVLSNIVRAVKLRAVIEFCSAFESVPLSMVSAGIGVDHPEVEDLLLWAVQKNLLNGRIDLIDKSYTKRRFDVVSQTCEAAQRLGQGAHRSAVQSAIIQARFSMPASSNIEVATQMAARQGIDRH